MRKTKIVCTIGPSSFAPETIEEMIRLGMDVARVNFSHGSRAEYRTICANVRKAARRLDKVVGFLADIPGPKLRITDLSTHVLELSEDELIGVVEGESLSHVTSISHVDAMISTTSLGVVPQLKVGNRISFADGVVQAEVVEVIPGGAVAARVTIAGTLTPRKGVNFPDSQVKIPALTPKDRELIAFACEERFDFIAISFVGSAFDMIEARETVNQYTGNHKPRLVAKIERPSALKEIREIVMESDAVMVARGDLGVEIAPEDVPIEQKRIIHLCNEIGKPVITATQMLESMVHAPLPTRAEATDVATAIFDGTDAIMLSAETAAGEFPLESVSYMDRIARRAESELTNVSLTHLERPMPLTHTVADAIALSAQQICATLPIKAVVAVTESGHSARVISKFRPDVEVLGAAATSESAGSLTLSFGVTPFVLTSSLRGEAAMVEAVNKTVEMKLAKRGDLVLVVAGIPFGVSGRTNLIKVQVVGEPVFEQDR